MEGRIDYKIAVMSKGLLTTGMKLVGVKKALVAHSTEEAESGLRGFLSDSEIGLIVMSGGTVDLIKERKLREIIDTGIMPLIIEVPGYDEKEVTAGVLRRLIMRAVGADIYGR